MTQIQFLHCINQYNMDGGDSEFADGFRVADAIRRRHTEEWELLTGQPVQFWDVGTDIKGGEFHKLNAVPMIK